MPAASSVLAAVLAAPGQISVRSVARAELGAHDVLVRVDACGVSGTCLRSYQGTFPGTIYPIVPGLEIAGTIEAVGAGGAAVQVGQRVVVDPVLSCDRCAACRQGRYNCCARLRLLGVHEPGGMATYLAVRSDRVHLVADDLPPAIAALCEPFAIGAQAVARGRVERGEAVVILGGGLIGQAILLQARAQGARVLVVEPHAGRRALAAELGATGVCAADAAGSRDAVLALTDGEGADLVVDATGAPAAIAAASSLAAHGGRLAIVGVPTESVEIPILEYVRKELDVYGVRNCRGRYPDVVDFVSRHRDQVQRLVTRVFPFAAVATAFEFARERGPDCLRAVLEMT